MADNDEIFDFNRILRYSVNPKTPGSKPLLNKAVKEFQQQVDPVKDPGEDEMLKALFAEWMIFDFEPKPGETLVSRYIEANPDHLDAITLIHIKQAAASSIISLFWVKGIAPLSHGVLLSEVRSGKEFLVFGKSMLQALMDPSGLIGVRILKWEDRWMFGGVPVMYQPMEVTPERMEEALVEEDEPRRPSFIELVRMAHGRQGVEEVTVPVKPVKE